MTCAALLKQKKFPKPQLKILDLSPNMLQKAITKMPSDTQVIKGDVMHLPFSTASHPLITCFGGFNSFPSAKEALLEIHRVLQPGGYLRGSVLLMPTANWKQKRILHWIKKGYQSEVIHLSYFESWLQQAGFSITSQHRMGDVFLFEGKKG